MLIGGKTTESLLFDIDFHGFPMEPNQNLEEAFEYMYSKARYQLYLAECGIGRPELVKGLTLLEMPLHISWPISKYGDDEANWGKDLGYLRESYAVRLSKNTIDQMRSPLDNQVLYLEIVELDDRYRFYVKYEQLLGSIPLFENFKGEKWKH